MRLHQFQIELQVFVLEHGVDALHLVRDATLRVIQALDEVVSVLRHEVGETEERVGFRVLCTATEKNGGGNDECWRSASRQFMRHAHRGFFVLFPL